MNQIKSAEVFAQEYADRSGVSLEWLTAYQVVRPCDCDYNECEGWQMISHEAAADIDDPNKPWAR